MSNYFNGLNGAWLPAGWNEIRSSAVLRPDREMLVW